MPFSALTNEGTLSRISLNGFVEEKKLQMSRRCSFLALSGEGLLAAMTDRQEVWVLDPVTLAIKKQIPAPNVNRVVSAPGLKVAFAAGNGNLSILDLVKGQIVRQLDRFPTGNARVTPDGKYFFAQGGTEQLCGYTIDGDNLIEHQKTGRIAQNGQAICVSPDGKFVCLPSGGGNYGSRYGTFVYAVDNLAKPEFTLESGAYPRLVGFDPVAQLCFTQRSGCQLIIYSMTAIKLKEYKTIVDQVGGDPKQFVTHPQGRKLLVQAGNTVMLVELDGIGSAPSPELRAAFRSPFGLLDPGFDFRLVANRHSAFEVQGFAAAVASRTPARLPVTGWPTEIAQATKTPTQPPPTVPIGGQLQANVLTKVKRATVYIRVTLADGSVAQGSGFFGVEPGLVLTNAHVVGMLKPNSPAPRKVEIVYKNGDPDSRTFEGKILGVDRSSDLALLRVQGDKLPEPLEVKSTTGLVETQIVYVFGFPFGEGLGKNITVSTSSVTSLRKGPYGDMDKVQVNGGMHPGNSGGPVVDASGAVVGVAVSGIEGTLINFAVPGEYVHVVLNGRVTEVGNGPTVRDGDQIKTRVNMAFLDPLNRVKKVTCEWWTAADGKPRPASNTQPAPLAGDSPHRVVEMSYASAAAHVDIVLPTNIPQGHRIFARPVVVNGTGKARWAAAVSYEVSSPVDKLPALLALKHYWAQGP